MNDRFNFLTLIAAVLLLSGAQAASGSSEHIGNLPISTAEVQRRTNIPSGSRLSWKSPLSLTSLCRKGSVSSPAVVDVSINRCCQTMVTGGGYGNPSFTIPVAAVHNECDSR